MYVYDSLKEMLVNNTFRWKANLSFQLKYLQNVMLEISTPINLIDFHEPLRLLEKTVTHIPFLQKNKVEIRKMDLNQIFIHVSFMLIFFFSQATTFFSFFSSQSIWFWIAASDCFPASFPVPSGWVVRNFLAWKIQLIYNTQEKKYFELSIY